METTSSEYGNARAFLVHFANQQEAKKKKYMLILIAAAESVIGATAENNVFLNIIRQISYASLKPGAEGGQIGSDSYRLIGLEGIHAFIQQLPQDQLPHVQLSEEVLTPSGPRCVLTKADTAIQPALIKLVFLQYADLETNTLMMGTAMRSIVDLLCQTYPDHLYLDKIRADALQARDRNPEKRLNETYQAILNAIDTIRDIMAASGGLVAVLRALGIGPTANDYLLDIPTLMASAVPAEFAKTINVTSVDEKSSIEAIKELMARRKKEKGERHE